MSPVIRISDEIFQRLQKHATPLVDTPATVIEKILDYCENGEIIESRKITKSTEINSNKDDFIKLDPDSPQDLTHTKILNGMFGNKKILNWNSLIQVAHIYAMEKTEDFFRLSEISISNISKGQRRDKGFHFIPEIGISIQGENANDTWKRALHLAKKLNLEIEILFEWRVKAKAANPGKKGYLYWKP
ncbi:hypothetical protein KC799_25410 [candidate division KSB1 bacterium]|nr:hypothetical protein [candidate division KSB1 bacterium]